MLGSNPAMSDPKPLFFAQPELKGAWRSFNPHPVLRQKEAREEKLHV